MMTTVMVNHHGLWTLLDDVMVTSDSNEVDIGKLLFNKLGSVR